MYDSFFQPLIRDTLCKAMHQLLNDERQAQVRQSGPGHRREAGPARPRSGAAAAMARQKRGGGPSHSPPCVSWPASCPSAKGGTCALSLLHPLPATSSALACLWGGVCLQLVAPNNVVDHRTVCQQ